MKLRKLVTIIEETTSEGGRPVDPVHRVAIVLAVIENPWAGQGFVADLAPLIDEVAPQLGELLSARCVEALGVPAEAYGKAGIVGLDGELEHALGPHPHAQVRQLLPHRGATPRRCCRRSRRWRPPAPVFDIPLKHITDDTIRSHHQSVDRLRPRRAARRRARDRPRRRQPRPAAGAARAAVDRAVIDGPVLLLHGVGLDRTVWDPVVALLDGADVHAPEPARPRRRPAGRPGHAARPGARGDGAERTWSASRSAAWSPPASRPTGPTSSAR